MKKNIAFLLLLSFLFLTISPSNIAAQVNTVQGESEAVAITVTNTNEAQLSLNSPSAVVIEGSTGTVVFEKNKDERLRPASITKVMTLLLIYEALASGQISYTDEVTVSEHAASMGGSQVYLEPNETQTVEVMMKCISIASGNDASVAMAEFIAGSEEEFVARMNKRAKELGMVNTNFVNSCGLDVDNHYSSAYDIALMSQELITKFPEISKTATTWMDTITHTTRKGSSEFGLTNTNRLVKSYNGITGLKTGSTGLAKYCLSATANRDGMNLIAVILAAPDTKTRFSEAAKLLNYGFANYSVYKDDNADTVIEPVRVIKGVKDEIQGQIKSEFSYLQNKNQAGEIRKEIRLDEEVAAPILLGDKVGEIQYFIENKPIGTVDIIATEDIGKATYKDCFFKAIKGYFLSLK